MAKVKAGKFQIPPEMAPGYYRANVGFYEVGSVLTLPDVESERQRKKGFPLYANPKLIPLNETAVEMQEWTEDRRVEAARDLAMRPPVMERIDPTERLKLPGIPKAEEDTVEVDDPEPELGDKDKGKGKGKGGKTRAADK